jgi:hypothetical protein
MGNYIKLDANMQPLMPGAQAIKDETTGLIWAPFNLCEGATMTHEKAEAAAKALRHCGKSDWRLPTAKELLSLVDYTRHDPGVDVDAFPFIKPNYYWTSTPVAGNAGYAWIVSFSYGDSYWLNRNYEYRALAVRSASQ